MIIGKYVYKGKGYYKDCEHLFEYIDNDRKVDINTTGELICKIKRWLNFFSKNKSKYLQDWNNYLNFYLIADGINPHIDKGQYYVKKNYKLLEDNKLLTYNEALFLLLGLNAHELGRKIIDFPVLDGDEPIAKPFEMEFWRTPQNQALRASAFVVDGKITSKNLKLLADADADGFFTELKSTNLKTVQKTKNRTTIQPVLLEFLEQSTRSEKYNPNELKSNTRFIKLLLKDNKIIVTETNEDANKKSNDRKPNEMTPTTLANHLTVIFKCSKTEWWAEQDKSIRDKVKKYQ